MATLTVQDITRDGVTPALVPADVAGDTFSNTGKEFIYVLNSSGAPIIVTLDIRDDVDGQPVTDRTVSVPDSGGIKLIGPIPPAIYNNAAKQADISYSAVAGLTVGILKLPL